MFDIPISLSQNFLYKNGEGCLILCGKKSRSEGLVGEGKEMHIKKIEQGSKANTNTMLKAICILL